MRREDFIKCVNGKLMRAASGRIGRRVEIDSKRVKAGCVFFAICGQRHDGHRFVREAARRGAGTVVVSKKIANLPKNAKVNVVAVADTQEALAAYAACLRDLTRPKHVIGITGSNGKTTTKEILGFLLKAGGKTLSNTGNQNNIIGLPLNLVRIKKGVRSVVMELGMNHRGEISRLSKILKPNIAVLTNIGMAHVGYLGSVGAIYRAKLEILEGMDKGAALIVNADDPYLRRLLRRKRPRIITYGITAKTDYTAKDIEHVKNFLHFSVKGIGRCRVRGMGTYQVYNALAAIAAARLCGIPAHVIRRRLMRVPLPAMRAQVKSVAGIQFVIDCYNANPTSMREALLAFAGQNNRPGKIAILGDMKELGQKSRALHRGIGRLFAKSGIETLIAVGKSAKNIYNAASEAKSISQRVYHCQGPKNAARILRNELRAYPKAAVLLKGSRQTRLEEIIKCFTTSSTS